MGFALQNYTDVFKALSDETRLRLLYLLTTTKKELCCCELTDSLEEPLYNVSRQLKILKNAGLVVSRKEGKWVYFSLTKNRDAFIKGIFNTIVSLPRTDRLKKDKKYIEEILTMREEGKCLHGILKKTSFKTKNMPLHKECREVTML